MPVGDHGILVAFLRDIWITWLVADATPENGGKRASPPSNEWGNSPEQTSTLFALCSKLIALPDLPAGFLFDVSSRTLRFRKKRFEGLLKSEGSAVRELRSDQRERILYDKHGLRKRLVRLNSYWYEDWRQDRIDWPAILPVRLAQRTEELFKVRVKEVTFPGTFVNGYAESEHVWAIRSDQEMCQLGTGDNARDAVETFFKETPGNRARLLQARKADAIEAKGGSDGLQGDQLPAERFQKLSEPHVEPVQNQLLVLQEGPQVAEPPQGAVRVEPTDEDELMLLEVVSGLEHLGLAFSPAYLVARIMEDFSGTQALPAEVRSYRFRRALGRLQDHDWMEQDLGARERPENALLKTTGPPRGNIDMSPELVAWLLRNPTSTDLETWRLVLGPRAVSCVSGRPELQRAIIDDVAAGIGGRRAIHVGYAQALLEDGEITLALQCLERFHGDPVLARETWVALAEEAVFDRSVDSLRTLLAAFLKADEDTVKALVRYMATPRLMYFLSWVLMSLKKAAIYDVLRMIERHVLSEPSGDSAIDHFFSTFDWVGPYEPFLDEE